MPANPWFPLLRRRSESSLRIFCFPFAGGSASTYRPWQAELPGDLEIWAAQPPGRETRWKEPAFTSAKDYLDAAFEAVSPEVGSRFALFGHSLGGIVAFELARRLERSGRPPQHVFVSGRQAPTATQRKAPISGLPDEEFLREVQKLEGLPSEVLANRELMELVLPTLRSDFQVFDSFRFEPGPPLSAPVSVLGGEQDPDFPPEDLQPWSLESRQFRGVRLFPGGHFFIHAQRSAVLAHLTQELLATYARSVAV